MASSSSSSWMSSATNATASLISIAAHELLIDPLHELGGAMEGALDLVVGTDALLEEREGRPERATAKVPESAERRSALGDVSNTTSIPAEDATKTPHEPAAAGGNPAPESMTFVELMALIETELNLDATLKPKEVLSIASELLGLEPLPESAAGASLKDEAIRVAQMLLPASSASDAASATTPDDVVRSQRIVSTVKGAANVLASPCCTPPAVAEARERRRTAFLLQEVGEHDCPNSAEKFLTRKSCRSDAAIVLDQKDKPIRRSDESQAHVATESITQDQSTTATDASPQPEPEPKIQGPPDLSLVEELLLLGIEPSTQSIPGSSSTSRSSSSHVISTISSDSDVFWNGNMSTALRGAILAELVLRGNIVVKQQGVVAEPIVSVRSNAPTGDMILDETLRIIQSDQSGAARGVDYWVPLLSGDTWSLKKMREQSLKQVRERATASLVRKGILTEMRSQKPKLATLHYAAALLDPTHSSTTYMLGELGVTSKAATVSRLRKLLTNQLDKADLLLDSQRVAAARNVLLCILARYSDVVGEVAKQWEDDERREAGERLRMLVAELQGTPQTTEQAEHETVLAPELDDVKSSLHWIGRYFIK